MKSLKYIVCVVLVLGLVGIATSARAQPSQVPDELWRYRDVELTGVTLPDRSLETTNPSIVIKRACALDLPMCPEGYQDCVPSYMCVNPKTDQVVGHFIESCTELVCTYQCADAVIPACRYPDFRQKPEPPLPPPQEPPL